MQPFATLIMTVLVVLSMSSCSTVEKTWDKTWDSTKGLYKTYVDTDPCVDLNQDSGCDLNEIKLAQTFMPVDEQLRRVAGLLNDRDTFPTDDWIVGLLRDHPWVTEVVVVSSTGEILARHPEAPIKVADLGMIQGQGWTWEKRTLRWMVEDHPLGPEMYLVSPFYKDSIWQGLVVAHFDPRVLVQRSPDPSELILLSSKRLIWGGKFEDMRAKLLGIDWERWLKDNVQGTFELDGTTYYWISSYLGVDPVVYAVQAVPEE